MTKCVQICRYALCFYLMLGNIVNVSHFKIFRWRFSINTADRKAHYYFHASCTTFKNSRKNNFSVFQRLALCPSLHSTFTKSNRDRIFVINLSITQNTLFYPVLCSVSLHCLAKLRKRRQKKKSHLASWSVTCDAISHCIVLSKLILWAGENPWLINSAEVIELWQSFKDVNEIPKTSVRYISLPNI